jgi:hypothetical protein
MVAGNATVKGRKQTNKMKRLLTIMLTLTALSTIQAGIPGMPPRPPRGDPPAAACGSLPDNYKSLALAAVKRELRDPYTAHMRIEEGWVMRGYVLATDANTWKPGITVSVLVNAKNGFGAYTGERQIFVSFYDGRIVNVFGGRSF